MPKKQLTVQQEMFIHEYIADPEHNQKQAAIRAGYHPDSASSSARRLMQTPEIAHEIEKQLKKIMDRLDISAETIVKGILDEIQKAKDAGPGAWQSQAAMRGFEMLGRHLGMFTEKIEIGVDDKIMQRLEAGRRRAAGLLEQSEDTASETGVSEPDKEPERPN